MFSPFGSIRQQGLQQHRVPHGMDTHDEYRQAGFALALLLAALVGGLYFADWLVLWMLGLKNAPLVWNTWWQYFQAIDLPQVAPYVGKIKMSGLVGFGLPLLVWLLLPIPLLKGKAESLHGDASFENIDAPSGAVYFFIGRGTEGGASDSYRLRVAGVTNKSW